MKSLPFIALALLLGACQTPRSGSDEAAEHAAQATTPRNLAELVQAYQGHSGHSLTYSEATGRLLESIEVSRVGGDDLDVLLISATAAAPEPLRVEVVRLEHAFAQELAPTLQELLRKVGAGAAPTEVEVRPDARTNSLILRGTPERLNELKALVARLDVEMPTGG